MISVWARTRSSNRLVLWIVTVKLLCGKWESFRNAIGFSFADGQLAIFVCHLFRRPESRPTLSSTTWEGGAPGSHWPNKWHPISWLVESTVSSVLGAGSVATFRGLLKLTSRFHCVPHCASGERREVSVFFLLPSNFSKYSTAPKIEMNFSLYYLFQV